MQLLHACHCMQATACMPMHPCLLLQVLDFPQAKAAKAFAYDHEWLATLRNTHHLFTLDRRQRPLPGEAVSTSQGVAVLALRAGPVSAAACQDSSFSGERPLPEIASPHEPASMC